MRVLFVFLLVVLFSPAIAFAVEVSAVHHTPTSPRPGATVVVTAKVSAGVKGVVLKLQTVAPGQYIRKTDPSYEKDWTDYPMHDDGQGGDAKAGDGIYSTTIPTNIQQHRWLIRYRISATDIDGKVQTFPAKDAASPNYAWWCYNTIPAWTGSKQPGRSPAQTYSPEFLGTLQTLHLIAKTEDVAKSQWDGNFHKQKQQGTIVYKGVVYDHIQYSNRGQGSAHISGKNKWGLKFNHDEELPLTDTDGKSFPDTLSSLNLNPGGSTPYIPVLRGITGLDEVLSMQAYRLATVPSPPATWVQWRVVDNAVEVSAKDQYQGDLWGVYVAMGEITPKMLSDRKLPDGLTVSIQSGIKHTPKGMTDGEKLWNKFLEGIRSNPKEAWWRENLDLNAYFSFHSMNRLLGNVDLRPDGNHGYYRNPNGHWSPVPWDNDMMFVPRHHQPGYIDAVNCLNHPKIKMEFQNRAREILDLFASDNKPNGGQVGQLSADLGIALTPKGYTQNWAKLDEAVWNYHPRMNQKGSYFVNPTMGDHFGGQWKRTLATNDFAGFQKYIVDFCTDSRAKKNYAPNDGDPKGYGWGYLAYEAKDDKIPSMPKVERVAGKFQASAFTSTSGATAGVVEWRVGRVGTKGWYELTDYWRKDGERIMEIPAEVFKAGGDYRVRARWKDSNGRCSHWSAAVEVKGK